METAAGELALILAAIYFVDCFRWVGRKAALFRWLPFLGWRDEAPWTIGTQFARLLAFGNPLPLGALLSAEGVVLRPQPERWVLDTAPLSTVPAADAPTLSWEELGTATISGLELRVRGQVLYTFGSKRAVAAHRRLLEVLGVAAAKSAKKRRQAIEAALATWFDLAALEQRLAAWRPWRWRLAITSSTLFLALVSFLALLVESSSALWRAVPMLALSWVSTLALSAIATRRLLPRAIRPHPFELVIQVVSPVSLIRCADVIEAELVGDFHPLALAAVLLPRQAASRYLSGAVRALGHPITAASGAAPELVEGDAWLRACLEKQVLALAAARGLRLEQAVSAGRHCPRCLTEYASTATGACVRCPGVTLVGPGAKAA